MSARNHTVMTLPVLAVSGYVFFTYFPVIYIYLPIFAKMKIVLLCGITMAVSYLFTAREYSNTTALRNPAVWCWAGLLALMVLGLAVSRDRGYTLDVITMNLKYFVVFLVMIKVIDGRERRDRIIGAFLACAVFMSIRTIFNYFYSPETRLAGYRGLALETGIFGDPNDLSMLYITAMPFALYRMIAGEKKAIASLAFCCLLVGTLLTYSRGGFVGGCAMLASAILLLLKRNRKIILLALLVACSIWAVAPESYKQRIFTISSRTTGDQVGQTELRLVQWKTAVAESLKKPFLGAGAGCSFYINGEVSGDWHSTHNSFLQVIAELGIVAFALYVMLYAIPLRHYGRMRKRGARIRDDDRLMMKIILIAILSYGTTAFFLPQAYSPLLYLVTAIHVIQTELMSRDAGEDTA